jgi:hypothetical protein
MRPAIWSSQQLEVDARRGDVKELAHALDCDRFRCPHLKEAAQ